MKIAQGSVKVLAVALLSCSVVTMCRAQQDAPLEKARGKYEQDRQRVVKQLSTDFDTVLGRINNGGGSAEKRLAAMDLIKAEKERFEEGGLMPWSKTMRPYAEKYLKSVKEVQNELSKAYGAEIDKHRKDAAKVADLRADQKSLLGIGVVAQWLHQPPGNGPAEFIKLYSDGRTGGPDESTTWTLERGNLVMRWPNPRAPGGVYVDTCELADDGLSYAGVNQKRQKISGVYTKP